MDIKGIISIAGKPGLHKVVSQTKNGLIAESLVDNKRFPVYSNQQISALEDISIYTYEEDILLSEVFEKIYAMEDGKETINHKASASELSANLEKALPKFDKERVYASDVKKIMQWYNLLHKNDLLKVEVKEEAPKKEEKKAKKPATEKKPAAEKKAPAKKAPAKKKETPKDKPAASKKKK